MRSFYYCQTSFFFILFTLIFSPILKAEKSLLIRVDDFFGGPVHKTGEPYRLSGEVVYMGTGTFESVYLNWQLGEDGEINTVFFEDIALNPYIPFRYEVPEKWTPETAGQYMLNFWFSGLNGDEPDVPASDPFQQQVNVYDVLAERDVVLLESFSSVNCGSCALVTPVLLDLISQNPDHYAQIYYHPLAHENSPLYIFNPKDQDARRDYYEVFYTPYSVIGGLFNGGSEAVDSLLLTRELEKWAGFDLAGKWFVHEDQLYLMTEGEVFLDLNQSDTDYRLFIAAIQDSLHFNEPPGMNGEKDFYNVMRFFAPDAQGLRLTPDQFQDSIFFEWSMPWHPDLAIEKMTLFAFVQDLVTSEIHQAGQLAYDVFMDPDEPDDPTNINAPAESLFAVYPNPASDLITVYAPTGNTVDRISLYDINGRRVINMKEKISQKNTIELTGLNPGLYILIVHSNGQQFRQKISIVP